MGAGRKCRYLGARRGIGGIRGNWGSPRGVGAIRGHQECIGAGVELLGGVRGHWGGKWASLGSQHSHWFPLGSDLPHQGQARAPFQGPITPTGFP